FFALTGDAARPGLVREQAAARSGQRNEFLRSHRRADQGHACPDREDRPAALARHHSPAPPGLRANFRATCAASRIAFIDFRECQTLMPVSILAGPRPANSHFAFRIPDSAFAHRPLHRPLSLVLDAVLRSTPKREGLTGTLETGTSHRKNQLPETIV